MQNREWTETYKWVLEILNSDTAKIEALSDEAYDNWLLSLFYASGIDKIDLFMKKKNGVEAVRKLINVAYHEAGHAVFHWLYCRGVGDLGIVIHPCNQTGVCSSGLAIDFVHDEQECAFKEAVDPCGFYERDYKYHLDSAQAGYAAADRLRSLYGERAQGIPKDCGDDWNSRYFMKRMYPDAYRNEIRRRLRANYRRVLKKFYNAKTWEAVEEVAKRLLVKNYMNNDEFREIMRRINPPQIY